MKNLEQEYLGLASQRQVLISEFENLASLLNTLNGAALSLEEVEKNVWISLGSQAGFILAKEVDKDVLVPVGFRFYIKMPKASAKEKIEKRISQVQMVINKLNAEIEKIDKRMAEMRIEALKARKGNV